MSWQAKIQKATWAVLSSLNVLLLHYPEFWPQNDTTSPSQDVDNDAFNYDNSPKKDKVINTST